jgi:hypothetical protein
MNGHKLIIELEVTGVDPTRTDPHEIFEIITGEVVGEVFYLVQGIAEPNVKCVSAEWDEEKK